MRRHAAAALALGLLLPGIALASGEPGITYTSRLYRLRLGAGARVTPADDAGDYFAEEEARYRRRLEPIVARIDAAVDKARTALGLVPYDPAHREPVDVTGPSSVPRRVLGRATVGKGGEELVLALSTDRDVDRARLDRLLQDIARLVATAREDGPPPRTPALVELPPIKIVRPGLDVTIRPETRWIVARHQAAIAQLHGAEGKRVVEAVLAALRALPGLDLPVDWPAIPPPGPAATLDVMLGHLPREVVIRARVPRKPDASLREQARRAILQRLAQSR